MHLFLSVELRTVTATYGTDITTSACQHFSITTSSTLSLSTLVTLKHLSVLAMTTPSKCGDRVVSTDSCIQLKWLQTLYLGQGCSGAVNSDLGERFPRPRSQQRGSLCPSARRVDVLGVGTRGGRPLPLRGSGGNTPWNFFLDFLCQIPHLGAIWARK